MSRVYKVADFRLHAVKFEMLGSEVDSLLSEPLAEYLKISVDQLLDYRILRKSIDSRRGAPELMYQLMVQTSKKPANAVALSSEEAEELCKEATLDIQEASANLQNPIIVGTGPAGLFAALVLAKAGTNPIVLDRGKDVQARAEDIANFMKSREFDENSNYLIGEGGAGTFSDGKLYTRSKDARCGWILKSFVEHGAAEETLYLKRPHLGSNRLPDIVASIREEIISLGGTFRFSCEVEDVKISASGGCGGVILSDGEVLTAPAVIIAVGLGARAMTRRLLKSVDYELKGFQIGSRIEHRQAMVDRRQYRVDKRPETLGAAEYNLVSPATPNNLGVSTFCMCPGGEIIPASACAGQLSSNGMSNFERSGEFANSTLVVTPKMNFANGEEALGYLSDLGAQTFMAGGGDYTFPAQDAIAFMRGDARLQQRNGSAKLGMRPFNLAKLLPPEAVYAFRVALRSFDRKWENFISEGKFVGLESYISSPIRFLRQPDGQSSLSGLYLAGEGAGMAGGIMSAYIR